MKKRLQEFLLDLDIDKKKLLFIIGGAVLVVLLLVIVLSTVPGGSGKKYDKLYQEAEKAYLAQDYVAAEEALRSAMELKNTEQAYLLMADIYCAQGETDRAVEILYLGYSRVGGEKIEEKLEALKGGDGDTVSPAPQGPVTVAGLTVDGGASSLVLNGHGLSSADRTAISSLTNMESLSISDCGVSDLSFLSGLRKLTMLQVSDNAVRDLSPLSGLTGLKNLYIDNNPIASLAPLKELKNLRTLSMKGISVSQEELDALKEALPNCKIYADAQKDEGPKEVTLGGKTFSTDVTELNLGNLRLEDISALASCTKLKKLDLRDNKITDLSPLVELQELEWLCIWNNEVEDINPLLSLQKLRYLDADGNKISDLTVLQYLPELEELWLGHNEEITSFEPLRALTKLTRLGLEQTGLDDGGLDCLLGMEKLKELNVKGNEDLSAAKFEELEKALPDCVIDHDELRSTIRLGESEYPSDAEEIIVNNQDLRDLSPLKSFGKLRVLNLMSDQITDLTPLRGLTTLEELYLSNNSISDLSPLSGCTNLKKLYISGNDITDLTPLAACRNLTELHLGQNDISDISALSRLTNLTELDIENNRVSDLSALYGLSGLKTLRIRGNDLVADDILALKTQLPDCVVTHDIELTPEDLDDWRDQPSSGSDLR